MIVANIMFDLEAIDWSTTDRSPCHLLFAEVIATLRLLLVIFGVVRSGRPSVAAFTVGCLHRRRVLPHLIHQLRQPSRDHRPDLLRHLRWYRLQFGPALIIAQLVGTTIAVAITRYLYPNTSDHADQVFVPHDPDQERRL
ncbi:MAG: hypothetical protein OEV40_09980 [Acidimicrobiia bacterium]|nr:hypothetical protein [Acidimicrobiia bacterium]